MAEMPKDNSWRPKFIPMGYESLDKNIYKNIFYSTSTGDSFRSPATQGRDHLHKFARSQSYQNIHDSNRGKAFKPNRAPLYQRSMCTHTQQYVPRPLDGFAINKECYDLFKEKCESGSTSSTSNAASATETTTKYSYPLYPLSDALGAIAPNFKPKQAKHVSDENKLLVTKSASHREFPCPSVEHTRNARPEACKPRIVTHLAVGDMKGISSYNSQFAAERYDAVWPIKFEGQEKAPGPVTGYTGLMALNPETENELEPEKFHIGDVIRFGPC